MSWDLDTAAAMCSSTIRSAVWSPCDGFIAISLGATMDVLDSVTFQRLQTLEFPQAISTHSRALIFSPDSHILTCSSGGCWGDLGQELSVISWDLQTGGIVGIIRWQGPQQCSEADNPSITYSADGKMVAVLHWYYDQECINISICDIASSVYMHSHSLKTNDPPNAIWTHGGSLQFTAIHEQTVAIWEVGFISGCIPTKVKTIPVDQMVFPCPKYVIQVLLLPTPCRLALDFGSQILVWDVQNSKCLLHYTQDTFRPKMSFSSDGCFFAGSTSKSDIHLWKESPTGYVLHQTITPRTTSLNPLLSQSGESMVTFCDHTIQLWHTHKFTTCPPSILTQARQLIGNFTLDFSPDGTLAMVAMQGDTVVTVLNLKSGIPQLTIDVGVKVYGLRVIGNTGVVICDGVVAAWNLPAGGYVPNARLAFKDRSWRIHLGHAPPCTYLVSASISPDSHYIALRSGSEQSSELEIWSGSTGELLGHKTTEGDVPWFTQEGYNVWSVTPSGKAEVWKVGSGEEVLEHQGNIVDVEHPPEGYPWTSSQGYRVTDDWWILGPDGKRLLILPPPWQSHVVRQVWKGQFLALLHIGLSEPVILEFEP
jgi:hypothetical protein